MQVKWNDLGHLSQQMIRPEPEHALQKSSFSWTTIMAGQYCARGQGRVKVGPYGNALGAVARMAVRLPADACSDKRRVVDGIDGDILCFWLLRLAAKRRVSHVSSNKKKRTAQNPLSFAPQQQPYLKKNRRPWGTIKPCSVGLTPRPWFSKFSSSSLAALVARPPPARMHPAPFPPGEWLPGETGEHRG